MTVGRDGRICGKIMFFRNYDARRCQTQHRSGRHMHLVTGGAGFIGSHLVDLLIENNHEVIVIDDLSTGSIGNVNKLANFEKLSLNNIQKVSPLFKGCEGVFHFAALPRIQPSFDEPILHNKVNISASLNIIKTMKDFAVKKIIFSSTSACYGNPIEIPTSEKCPVHFMNPYALQKFTSEQYILILSLIHI